MAMTLFSAGELADLIALDRSAMQDTCTIEHDTQVADAGGAFTIATTTTTSACRLVTSGASTTLYLPIDTALATHDRVKVSDQLYVVRRTAPPRAYNSSRVAELVLQVDATEGAPDT
jgi:hypothetical protein